MDLHCDLDTMVLIVLNLIGWGMFVYILWKDRGPQLRHSHPA